jgi:transposase InsO family protein
MNTNAPRLAGPPNSPDLHDPEKYQRFLETLSERQRRHCVALEALRLGRRGVTRMAQVSGLHVQTIWRGRREILAGEAAVLPGGFARKPGGGRPRVEARDPKVEQDLAALVAPETAGDPCSAKTWVRSSLSELARRLCAKGHRIGKMSVRRLLKKRGAPCARATSGSRARRTRTATGSFAISRPARLPF